MGDGASCEPCTTVKDTLSLLETTKAVRSVCILLLVSLFATTIALSTLFHRVNPKPVRMRLPMCLRTVRPAMLRLSSRIKSSIIPRRLFASNAHAEGSADFVKAGLKSVRNKMESVCKEVGHGAELIAVSKTKPVELLRHAYDAGQRAFGENYAQELIEKAPQMPDDTEWHFIGKLQSNKINPILKGVPNLKAVHTVHSEKVARKIGNACKTLNRDSIDIYIQVDTSGEVTKNGVDTGEELVKLAELVASSEEPFDRLKLVGLMTIGAPGDLSCFDKLVEARKMVASKLGVDASDLKLSMGMSGDFEEAIKRGSNLVRVGSTIFGARDYSKK